MPKIRELINFEPIKEVIDIDAISNSKEMVENYVISPSLEEHLVHVFRDLQKSTHKAPQIVGVTALASPICLPLLSLF